jgi:hypothetical protein
MTGTLSSRSQSTLPSVAPAMLGQVAPLARRSESAFETLDILVRAWEEKKGRRLLQRE